MDAIDKKTCGAIKCAVVGYKFNEYMCNHAIYNVMQEKDGIAAI